MINYMFSNSVRYLLIDEFDKLCRKDQGVLLNLMENNMLVETKIGKTSKKEMKVSEFATCNDISRISNPLKSRYRVLELEEYTYEQFLEIAKELLTKRYSMTESLSTHIAQAVWDSGSKEVQGKLLLLIASPK
jgi:ATP-dependent Lon protease